MIKTICRLLLCTAALLFPSYALVAAEEPSTKVTTPMAAAASSKEHDPSIPSAPIAPPPYFVQEEEPQNELFKDESGNSSRFFQEFLHMLSILGIMIAVLLLAAWSMKRLVAGRMQQGNTTSSIKILERRGLTAKTAIYLIEIDEQRIAIAESSNGATLLFHMKSSEPSQPSFEQLINR